MGFRKIIDQLSAVDSQFNRLDLVNESPKSKKCPTNNVKASKIA